MARIRSIHPGLFTDEAFMAATAHARVLLIGLWTEADDQGVFEWKPLTIKARLLPADMVDIPALMVELEGLGQLLAFEHGGKHYGALKNFRKYQRPQKPNAIHPLPDSVRLYVGLSDTDTIPVRDQSSTDTVKSLQREEEGGEKEVTPSGSNEPSGERTRELSARQVFETILTPERAKALVDQRQRKKAAQTAHAAELVVNGLRAFADPNAAADLMIVKGWTSIEPEWGTRNGLSLAGSTVSITGVIPSTFIATDDRRWPMLAQRFEALNGKKCTGMQTRDGYGRYFPTEWVKELESPAEAAA